MFRCLKYQLLISLTVVLTGSLRSQFIYDTLQLNELEIISSHYDLSSTTKSNTIDSIARKELNLSDIGELLSAYTPVFVKSYGKGSLSTVSFRGTGASHTKVLWEGFNINSPMLGQTDFSLLPGVFFDEVKLLYGGSSLSESSGALGGSISLTSNGIHQRNNPIAFVQTVGSYNTYQTSIGINLGKSKLYSGTRIFRQSSENNFSYYNNAIKPKKEMNQTNADFVNFGFTQQFQFQLSEKQSISFITWNQWNNRDIPTIMTNVEKGGNQKEWQDDVFSKNILKWVIHNVNTKMELVGAYFFENMNYYLHTSDSLGTTISQNKIKSYSLSGKLSKETNNGTILKTSFKLIHENINSNNYLEKKQRNLFNAFVSLEKKLTKSISAEALIRSEISDVAIIPIMPMLGINYKPFTEHDLHFRLVLSRNKNIPSLNDLYWYPNGNEDLVPEISLDSEFGIEYAHKLTEFNKISFVGSVYASSVKNWIIWQPGDYYLDWGPENIPNVFARGIELSVKTNGKFGNVIYTLFGEYAYTRSTNNSPKSKNDGTSDIQLLYVPIHSVVGYLNINLKGYYATWSLSYTGYRNTSFNSDDNYSFRLPGYTLNNMSVGKSISIKKSKFELRFKVNNIFNIDYQAVLWRAMPGRNYEISISFKL
ncbi:MAG: TonB-dependent receptor [Bacteroidetes bacterium]|nr:TonB-dependent receptor [Bacteroidota bacterium]